MARFRCRQLGCTVSLLPDCLAARLAGTLEAVEATVRLAEQAPSGKAAAEQARPDHVEQPAAERWTRRRVQPVRRCLEWLRMLESARFGSVEPTLAAFGTALGMASVLVGLRAVAAARLGTLPPPLGFWPARKPTAGAALAKRPHRTGLDPPGASL